MAKKLKPEWNPKWKRWEIEDSDDGLRGLGADELKSFLNQKFSANHDGVFVEYGMAGAIKEFGEQRISDVINS